MRRYLILLVLAVGLLLAGCGSHHATSVAPAHAAPGEPYKGRPRTASEEYMQCAAFLPGALPPNPAPKAFGLSQEGFGIDFAWGGPSGTIARDLGAHFGASYLSESSKDWNPSTLKSYLHAGLGVVFVWETSADRPLGGYNAGYDDAYAAYYELRNRYGITQSGVHDDFAADFDSTGYNIRPYYQGAEAWDKRVGDTAGAYGGLTTVDEACSVGLRENWQTIAWSGGQRASTSCAPLFQYSINDYWHGVYSSDYDQAYAGNYGQLGYTQPPPAIVCFGKHAQGNATCRKVHAEVASWQKAASQSTSAYQARGCVKAVATRNVLAARWDWYWTQLREHPKVKHASRERALKATGNALNQARRTVSGKACLTFSGRVTYYDALIKTAQRTYS